MIMEGVIPASSYEAFDESLIPKRKYVQYTTRQYKGVPPLNSAAAIAIAYSAPTITTTTSLDVVEGVSLL